MKKEESEGQKAGLITPADLDSTVNDHLKSYRSIVSGWIDGPVLLTPDQQTVVQGLKWIEQDRQEDVVTATNQRSAN